MKSIESLKDYLIADEIQRIKLLTRDRFVRELIAIEAEKVEYLKDLNEVMKYGKQKPKA